MARSDRVDRVVPDRLALWMITQLIRRRTEAGLPLPGDRLDPAQRLLDPLAIGARS